MAATVTVTAKKEEPGEFNNILDSYRAITYNFTLACITPDQLKNPQKYRNKKNLDFVIAKSAGKKVNAMNADAADDDEKSTVEEFNKFSPGAYDLFVDNVEIDTIMAPNEQTGPALGTKVAFEVYEPYSVNGFIEALHVAGKAAGWGGYINACFLLKIEFRGYPDKEIGPTFSSSKIPADKYITIRLTGAEIEVTEQGTRYRCKGIPVNETGFSQPLRLTAATQMKGETVRDVLKDLEKALNEEAEKKAENEKGDQGKKIKNKFKIIFPEEAKPDEALKTDSESNNDIGKAKINETLKENNVYQFPTLKEKENSPKGSDQNRKYDPKNPVVQFAANADILDIITAVVRDSSYLESTLQKIKTEAKDGDGMVDYFQVMVNAIPLKMDETNNLQLYEYQYLVVPYKVHVSKFPDQQHNTFKAKRLDKLVKRKYDYLYGGKNIDVLGFKLNFNNLYFQASPPNMGNKPELEQQNAAAPSNNSEVNKKVTEEGKRPAGDLKSESPSSIASLEAVSQEDRAAPNKTTPYWQLAVAAHRAILESVNLLTGDLEIIGDPYYLCTSGMGNYLPKIKDTVTTVDGEANFNAAPVVIELNFRNPIDIGTNGFLKFREVAPFSGLYQVLKCKSTFNDGVFKQSLRIMRYNGQLEDRRQKEKLAEPYTTKPKDEESQKPDSAPPTVQKAGVRPNTPQLASLISQGLPINGLPGDLSSVASSDDFVPGITDYLTGETLGGAAEAAKASSGLLGNALGKLQGLGSGLPSPGSLLSQASGVLGQGINLANQTLVPGLQVGQSLGGIDPLQSGLRLGTGAINDISNSVKGLANNAAGTMSKLSNALTGNGANLGIDQKSAVIKDALGNGISPDLALRTAGSFGLNVPKVGDLNPTAMMSKLGLDPKQLTGLGGAPNDVAKKIKDALKEVPDDVSLSEAGEQGIVLANLNKNTIKNLPAIAPDIAAPEVELPNTDRLAAGDPAVLEKFGLSSALGAMKSNIPGGLSNLGNLKNGLPGLPSLSGLPNIGSSIGKDIPGVSDFSKSVTANFGSLSGASPLTKLMSKTGSPGSDLKNSETGFNNDNTG